MYPNRHRRPAPRRLPPGEIVHGIHPVLEALTSGVHVEKLLVRREAGGEGIRNIKQLAREREVPWQPVPVEKLDRLTTGEHQGVIAFLSAVELQDLSEVVNAAFTAGEDPLLIALDGVTDVRNMGAIARSAECFAAHGLVVPKQDSARLGADAVKSSAGALLRRPVCRVNRLEESLRMLKDSGLRIVGCTEKTDTLVYDADLSGPIVLVMGAEDEGISPGVRALCDAEVAIPMYGAIGSLNVSVAAGIILHETARQRRKMPA